MTRSWTPCKFERRIWVSPDLALPASILAARMCLQNWAWSLPFPAHKHSIAPHHPWDTSHNPTLGIWPGPVLPATGPSCPVLQLLCCTLCPSCSRPIPSSQPLHMLFSWLRKPCFHIHLTHHGRTSQTSGRVTPSHCTNPWYCLHSARFQICLFLSLFSGETCSFLQGKDHV